MILKPNMEWAALVKNTPRFTGPATARVVMLYFGSVVFVKNIESTLPHIVDKKPSGWGLPCGGIRGDEIIITGIEREFREETGATIEEHSYQISKFPIDVYRKKNGHLEVGFVGKMTNYVAVTEREIEILDPTKKVTCYTITNPFNLQKGLGGNVLFKNERFYKTHSKLIDIAMSIENLDEYF